MASCRNVSQLSNLKAVNFNNWFFRLKGALDAKGVLHCIESEVDTKETKNDAIAKNNIISCLSDTHLSLIKEFTTSKRMIEKLKNAFQRKSSVSKLYLRRQLLSIVQWQWETWNIFHILDMSLSLYSYTHSTHLLRFWLVKRKFVLGFIILSSSLHINYFWKFVLILWGILTHV